MSDVVLEMWEQSSLEWDEENHAFYSNILIQLLTSEKVGENKTQNM